MINSKALDWISKLPRQAGEKLAREFGLQLHVPPAGAFASIWYPGDTLFLVFTLPGVVVRWLPEQQGGGKWQRTL